MFHNFLVPHPPVVDDGPVFPVRNEAAHVPGGSFPCFYGCHDVLWGVGGKGHVCVVGGR